MSRTDRLVAVGLALGTVLLSWALAVAAGTTDVPRTDDWGFAREAFDLHRTGHLQFIFWGPMTIVGHLLWAQPFLAVFGPHRWVLSLSTSVLVAAGVVAAYSLARRRLSTLGAATSVGVLLVFPGVVRDAATYMSDPPALSLQLITLAVGAAALGAADRRRWVLFSVSMATGFWAFSIRELAVAAPAAVLITMFLVDRTRLSRVRVAGGGALLALACATLWIWHRGLTGVERYRGRPPIADSVVLIVSATLTVGLALAPALAFSVRRWWPPRHRRARASGAAVGVAIVAGRPWLAGHLGQHNWWLVGDYLQADGINGGKLLLGWRPIVLHDALWQVLVGIACLSTVVCAALVTEWIILRPSEPSEPVLRLVGWHVGASVATLAVAAVVNGAMYDRYLWPLVFSSSLLLLGRRATPSDSSRVIAAAQVVSALVTVVAVGTSALLTLNSAAFDAARWQAATEAVDAGTMATELDGGMEWDGAHSTVPNRGGVPSEVDPLVAWWTTLTGMERVCIVVTASPVVSTTGRLVRTVHWRTYLVGGDAVLYVYDRCG